jgi:hypothetical protein
VQKKTKRRARFSVPGLVGKVDAVTRPKMPCRCYLYTVCNAVEAVSENVANVEVGAEEV